MGIKKAEIIRIGLGEVSLLEEFIAEAGTSLQSFRYFDKRPFAAISNHLLTCLLLEDGRPVGYGHLDKDNDETWLGIAVIERAKGKGLGHQLMEFLKAYAQENIKNDLKLTVDKDNFSAIRLYAKFGFVKVRDINERSVLMILSNEK